ncbi:MAG TPA: hypothetical protein VFB31_12275 [Pseudolabrys sp.]|nr:hypothetical protein [Pseudolabrys sp.]
MADYHPLISKAVAGLEKNTGENRRVLYERARTALVNQLRGIEPALDESDITRERLALEEAIRKVEAEAAKRTRDDEAGAPPAQQRAPSLTNQGLRGFRETIAEAEGLGGAAAEASRGAREVYDAVPGARDGAGSVHYFEPPRSEPPPPVSEPDMTEEAPPSYPRGRQEQAEGAPPPYEEEEYARPPRSYGGLIKIVVALLVVAGLAGGFYWQRHTIGALIASFRSAPVKPPQQQQAAPAGRPKITDRIGDGGQPSTANAPAAAVAQKVVLYDEDPNNPQGHRYVGSAIWRTETVSPGPGLAPELAVRADVDIPERHVRMTWSLRRNADKALPASHTIEIQFTLPADFDQGGIGNIPGVLIKGEESGRGVPLAGLAVKVTNGYFLIGLSAVEVDLQRNIEMLKQRDWLDIPIVYTSGKRAILSFEKGTPGQRAFEEAFRAWGE